MKLSKHCSYGLPGRKCSLGCYVIIDICSIRNFSHMQGKVRTHLFDQNPGK